MNRLYSGSAIIVLVATGMAAPPDGERTAMRQYWKSQGVVVDDDDEPLGLKVTILPSDVRWTKLHSRPLAGESPQRPEILLSGDVIVLTGPIDYTDKPFNPSSAGVLQGFLDPTSLNLDFTEFGDVELGVLLKGREELRHLSIDGTNVTGVGLKSLKMCPRLNYVNLSDTQIDDESLKQIAGLKQLTWLSIGGTKIRGTGLTALASLEHLETLYAHRSELTDDGLNVISQSKSLQTLCVAQTRITRKGLACIARMRQLRTLDVGGIASIDDQAITSLGKMDSLEILYLDGTKVSTRSAEYVATFPKLRVVFLERSSVSDEEIGNLSRVFPEISWIGNRRYLAEGVDDFDIMSLAPVRIDVPVE